jgi:hypothetical protein
MFMLFQAAQQPVQVRSSEVPVERCRGLLAAALEGQQASFDSARSVKSLGATTLRCTIEK